MICCQRIIVFMTCVMCHMYEKIACDDMQFVQQTSHVQVKHAQNIYVPIRPHIDVRDRMKQNAITHTFQRKS